MRKIELSEADHNLMAGIQEPEGWEAFEADYPGATVSNQCYHIVFKEEIGRGGIVFVGSGSSGATSWTDAESAEDVLNQALTDTLNW